MHNLYSTTAWPYVLSFRVSACACLCVIKFWAERRRRGLQQKACVFSLRDIESSVSGTRVFPELGIRRPLLLTLRSRRILNLLRALASKQHMLVSRHNMWI